MEIPADYDPQSQREQTFTVNGTVILEGTGTRCKSGLDVITRPGEEWKKNISVQVTVEGDPQYKVTGAGLRKRQSQGGERCGNRRGRHATVL